MDLQFEISKQKLIRKDSEEPVDNSIDYLQCKFDFKTNEWNNLTRNALFFNSEFYIIMPITETETTVEGETVTVYSCSVPWEILTENYFGITVVGLNNTTKRITTNSVQVNLLCSDYSANYTPTSPSVDFFQVLVNTKFDDIVVDGSNLKFYANGVLVKTVALGSVQSIDWANISNKPVSFPPSSHSHSLASCSDDNNHKTVSLAQMAAWDTKVDIDDLADVAISGDYDDLLDKPSIPSKTSQLQNDSNFLTEHQSLSNYYKKSETYSDDEIDTELAKKVDKVTGKGLSENDFTTILKNKLDGLSNYDDTTVLALISAINSKIPNQASSSNQLGDKEFINSSIATATATFRGTYNTLAEIQAIEVKDENDYAFLKVMDSEQPSQVKQYDKYKYSGSSWVFEYTLNNSSFTASQWGAINSGLTSTSLNNYYNKSETDTALNGKSDTSHNHTGTYSPVGHNHDSSYASINHNHDNSYSNINHTHNNMEVNTNKVNSISSSSTNTQYASAKAVYDFVTDYIESLDGDNNDW